MATFERRTRVRAPLADVWAFHSRVEGLLALTPDWVRLRVESIEGPDGDLDPDGLPVGTTIHLSVRPFGVGPRQHSASHIEVRRRDAAAAAFRDRLIEGPPAEWVHTHAFYADGDATVVRDAVEYELPAGPASGVAGRLATVGLAPLFRYRHRRTRALLEE